MKLLLTGFEPFGGEKINPALEALKLIPSKIGGTDVIVQPLPTSYSGCVSVVENAMNYNNPDAVVCVGQAGGRSGITVERIAINADDCPAPDNDGIIKTDSCICDSAPAAYFSTLPIKAMVDEIRKAGLPASVSDTAGTYVCNHLFYSVMHMIDYKHMPCIGGFVHVPFIPCQTVNKPNVPSMSLDDIVTGLTAAINAIDRRE